MVVTIITMEIKIVTDIHSHLLFGIDDGVRTLEESVKIIKKLKKIGYKNLILTPHYIKESKFNSNRENNLKLLDILKKELIKEQIDRNIYLGNEIYIDDEIIKLIKDNAISSLNSSNYLLIELPMSGEYDNYEEVFHDLTIKGYHVILAHPERYLSFQKDFNKVYELEKIGVLFQSNINSIIGGYGTKAKKMMKRLLKERKISYLASDIHRGMDYSDFEKAHKKMLKYINEEEYQKLININPSKIINNVE